MPEKILFVDDDTNLLGAMARNLRDQFSLATAASPDQALALLEKYGPFAVIVSDFKMPGMNGIELLSKTMAAWPDTVRILLTGEADTFAAIAAVNQGQVYRFLTKPCLTTPLKATLKAAIEQHNLIQAERVLLEKTLIGSLHVLTEILSFAHPLVFSRASRMRQTVKALAEELKIANPWEFEVAAMLSQIGCITLPESLLQRVCAGDALAEADRAVYLSHPEAGARFLQNIPRLETVVHIIRRQFDQLEPLPPTADLSAMDRNLLGLHLLKTAMDAEAQRSEHSPLTGTITGEHSIVQRPSSRFEKAMADIRSASPKGPSRIVCLSDLRVGMKLHSDILDSKGALLLSGGNEISAPLLQCLHRYSESRGVTEPFRICADE